MTHEKVTVFFRSVDHVREENQAVFTSASFSVVAEDFSLVEDFNIES